MWKYFHTPVSPLRVGFADDVSEIGHLVQLALAWGLLVTVAGAKFLAPSACSSRSWGLPVIFVS